MDSSRTYRTRAVLQSALVIATGAVGFWLLVTIPREATVILIEQGPINWITNALWLVALVLAVKHRRGIGRHWRDGLTLVGVGTVLFIVTVIMDHIQKSMRDRGPTGDRYVLGIAEETMEVIVPVFFILVLLQIGAQIRRSKATPAAADDDRIDQ